MWRINAEDWERKKTYLIRSLFHDLPLLSPVPESRESSCSPTGVTSRAHSPLPPLIIERMPNRHDEPPEFYTELERKMRKVYRKLLYDEDSSSIESLLARCGGDYVTYDADRTGLENYQDDMALSLTNADSEDENNNFVTAIEVKSISKTQSDAAEKSLKVVESTRAPHFRHDMQDSAPDSSDDDNQSSINTPEVNTQVTQATVHEPPSIVEEREEIRELDYDSPVYEEETPSSPLLTCQKLFFTKKAYVKPIVKRNEIEVEVVAKKLPSANFRESQTTEDRTSPEQNTSETSEEVTNDTNEKSVSYENVEVMRKERAISPSLGSVQEFHDDEIDIDTTIDLNIEFNRRNSLEIHSNGSSGDTDVGDSEVVFQKDDFNSITFTSSPKSKRKDQLMSNKRLYDDFNSENDFVTKRLKLKDTGVQASLTCEEEESSDWDYLKKNFFVGVPKVYKLCICKNHFCDKNL